MRIFTIIITTLFLLPLACAKQKTTTETVAPKIETVSAVRTDAQCQTEARQAEALAGRTVMSGVTLTDSTPIATLVGHPDSYKDKTVRIEGVVVEVCAKAGCFVALEDSTSRQLNLKVVDGSFDFRDVAVAGLYVVGEGTFDKRGPHGAQIHITGAMVGKTVCH